ncbi:hypothetical protein GCM10023185_23550 [Hymenobacter saemangeumensis]|uniref:TonB C-terminal domain-containing protein n=1 Tax=Hymenobacter saemangeumensis TaxID=1084522 RepID=A0ABP8IG89_9BACT
MASAQEVRTYPYKTTEYVSGDGRLLPGPEGAHQRLEYTYRDSLSGTVRMYNASGKLVSNTPYAHMASQLKFGPETTYYETGELRTKDDYVSNMRNGEFLVFYKDGKIKRREIYKENVRITGECYDSEGKVLPFSEYEVMPRFRGGGLPEMVKAIHHNLLYPQDALRQQIEGKVWVSFVVGADGQIQDVKIVRSLWPSLDKEVVRSVRKLRDIIPGTQDGMAVPVSYITPITFAIQ